MVRGPFFFERHESISSLSLPLGSNQSNRRKNLNLKLCRKQKTSSLFFRRIHSNFNIIKNGEAVGRMAFFKKNTKNMTFPFVPHFYSQIIVCEMKAAQVYRGTFVLNQQDMMDKHLQQIRPLQRHNESILIKFQLAQYFFFLISFRIYFETSETDCFPPLCRPKYMECDGQ